MNSNSLLEFFHGLEFNFKRFVQHLKTFHFGNFGLYFLFLLILGIVGLIITLIRVYLASFIRSEYYIREIEDFSDYFKYANTSLIAGGIGIIGIGVFALMIGKSDWRSKLSIGDLIGNLKPAMWKNILICISVFLGASIFLSGNEMDSFYFRYNYSDGWDAFNYDYDHGEQSRSERIWDWFKGTVYLIYYVLPFYFAALLVQLRDRKFNLAPAGRVPHIFAGVVLLMSLDFILMRIINGLNWHVAGLVGSATNAGFLYLIIALAISVFIGVIALGAKASILGWSDSYRSIPETDEIQPDNDILDDL